MNSQEPVSRKRIIFKSSEQARKEDGHFPAVPPRARVCDFQRQIALKMPPFIAESHK